MFHDLLGFLQHPHHAKVSPKFCKQYARVGENIQSALAKFINEVGTHQFPDERFTPYTLEADELELFKDRLAKAGFS